VAPAKPPSEPRNPLYLLLLITGVLFAVTAIAYTVIPVIEEKALQAGEAPPPSPWRDALRNDGWRWLLWELAALIVLGLLSMGLDRYRRMQRERAEKS
jgi:hypothetical protein